MLAESNCPCGLAVRRVLGIIYTERTKSRVQIAAGAYFFNTMLSEIGQHIREHLSSFPPEDKIIFNSSLLSCNPALFTALFPNSTTKTVAFIDGGQAEIISAGNFCLSFIRVGAVLFQGDSKVGSDKKEFYVFTKARYINNEVLYESMIFPVGSGKKLIEEKDVSISSTDSSIRIGMERAPITAVSRMARRFAELQLAASIHADHVLLDGTLEPTLKNEEKYVTMLPASVSALAKTCSLFTASGNNPVVLLNKIAGKGCWSYRVENRTCFVKLQEQSKYVFRFEGNADILPYLLPNSRDALFLGYPYGLILADQLARVSNEEKNSLRMNFLLRQENKEIMNYLNATNAHEILDRRG